MSPWLVLVLATVLKKLMVLAVRLTLPADVVNINSPLGAVVIVVPPKSMVLADKYRVPNRLAALPMFMVLFAVGNRSPVKYVVPPTFRLPAIPAPPATCSAPVEVLVLVVVFVVTIAELVVPEKEPELPVYPALPAVPALPV